MNCINDTKHWTVYDAKSKQFIYLTHEEFKNFLLDRPVKLMGRLIKIDNGDRKWIDGMINTDWWK